MPTNREVDLYEALGVARTATSVEVRRAYRNLSTRLHPDKGGNAEQFRLVHLAYAVLSDSAKRQRYDTTGEITRTADDEFLETFSKGTFKDPVAAGGNNASSRGFDTNMADQIIMHQGDAGRPGSHTAGFEAWMRSRSSGAQGVFDAEAAALQFGVVKASYEPVPLMPGDVLEVKCSGPGRPKEVLALSSCPMPPSLEWGQVAVDMQLAPINPADMYSARLGGMYGSDAVQAPYVAGHDGVGAVSKVGPGVKHVQEGDVVLPLHSFMGTWRSKAVWPARDLMKVPQDLGLPMEYLAMGKELCLAYVLLERYGSLKPGDCVILNAANSTVGQVMLQLCKLLKLRAVAVARDVKPAAAAVAGSSTLANDTTAGDGSRAGDAVDGGVGVVGGAGSWERMATYLKAIGATEVLKDEGSLKVELDKLKFFAKPKLALDAVGSDSGLRLADALVEGGELVMYGCMSGKPPPFQWQAFVFKELRVSGFNFRRWISGGSTSSTSSSSTADGLGAVSGADAAAAKVMTILRSVGKLVAANLLALNYTEYDLATEFEEALDHAMDSAKNTKVLLRGCASAAPVLVTPATVEAASKADSSGFVVHVAPEAGSTAAAATQSVMASA